MVMLNVLESAYKTLWVFCFLCETVRCPTLTVWPLLQSDLQATGNSTQRRPCLCTLSDWRETDASQLLGYIAVSTPHSPARYHSRLEGLAFTPCAAVSHDRTTGRRLLHLCKTLMPCTDRLSKLSLEYHFFLSKCFFGI